MTKYSVIATIYNDKKEEVLQLLNDVAKQTYSPDEIIIVDGGSSDEKQAYVNHIIQNFNISITYSTGKRLNISQGLNEAVRLAKNDYVMIVAVGNKYKEDCVYNLMDAISNRNIDYAYCPFAGQNNTNFAVWYNQVFLNKNKGIQLDIASNHGVLISKKIFYECGFFYENFIYAGEDEELYKKIKKAGYIGECVEKSMIFWDTPHNRKEYFKQVKNYTIARMQMYNFATIFKMEYRSLLYVFSIFVLIVLSCINIKLITLPCFVILYFNLKWFYRNALIGIYLHNLESFYLVYVHIRYIKFFSKKYKFDNNKRYKLEEGK